MKTDWLKLKENICPICGNKIIRSGKLDYDCLRCNFYAKYRKAQAIINGIEIRANEKALDKMTDDWLAKHDKNV